LKDWIKTIKTIKTVKTGTKVLNTILTHSLFTQHCRVSPASGKELPADSIWFTHREQEVVGLIAKGQRNKEIAESLHIPAFTVNLHVRNILENLEL
jgi:DNA-binding NarL/FixJ family response regulator